MSVDDLPPYQVTTTDQRDIWATKGKRAIGFGLAWLVGGLLLTVITFSNAMDSGGGVYIVAWGPVLYGIIRLISGYRLLAKSRT